MTAASPPVPSSPGRAAYEDALRGVLKEHFLMTVVCDPKRKQDNPVCQCSRVHLGWHPSIGQAVDAWIDHVMGELPPEAAIAVASTQPPEVRIAPCPVETHDEDHVQVRTGTAWLCGHVLAQLLTQSGVIPDAETAFPAVMAENREMRHLNGWQADRIRALRDLADEMLSRFVPGDPGSAHTARAGQIQITEWRKRAETPAVPIDDALNTAAAVSHFADTWRGLLTETLIDHYGCTLQCAEANAIADLYRALGDDQTADAIIAAHAAHDEPDEEHYAAPGTPE